MLIVVLFLLRLFQAVAARVKTLLLHDYVLLVLKVLETERLRVGQRCVIGLFALIVLRLAGRADLELVAEFFLDFLFEAGVRLLEIEFTFEFEWLAVAAACCGRGYLATAASALLWTSAGCVLTW